MSNGTPATYLTWTILSVLLEAFLLTHLYKYDKFKCLKWNHGPYAGAFKRFMTYTYLLTIPLIMIYALGFTVIKYQMGWTHIPNYGDIPVPWQLWPQKYKQAIFPLNLVFAVAWSLEMVTHLEELCFWLFLLSSGRSQSNWFRSVYFKVWAGGSALAVIYMPLVTIFTRSNPLKGEAYLFLAGSLGDLTLTICSTPMIWTFQGFIQDLAREDADAATLIRLVKFQELNSTRIIFRYIFVIPFVILGIDGARPVQHVNTSYFWSEFLTILAGIGVVVSSGITLMIFFPRSVSTDFTSKRLFLQPSIRPMQSYSGRSQNTTPYLSPKSPISYTSDTPQSAEETERYARADSPTLLNQPGADVEALAPPVLTYFTPNRRLPSGGVLLGGVTVMDPKDSRREKVQLNELLHDFRSPIDLVDRSNARQRR